MIRRSKLSTRITSAYLGRSLHVQYHIGESIGSALISVEPLPWLANDHKYQGTAIMEEHNLTTEVATRILRHAW